MSEDWRTAESFSFPEAARLLGRTPDALRKQAHKGQLPTLTKDGRTHLAAEPVRQRRRELLAELGAAEVDEPTETEASECISTLQARIRDLENECTLYRVAVAELLDEKRSLVTAAKALFDLGTREPESDIPPRRGP